MKRKKSDVISVEEETVDSFRELVPTHYVFTIQSFSMLTKYSIENYESDEFEAGGYKWKLLLYPEGNKNENVKDHISLYLVLADSTSFPPCWKLKVMFRLFLFDQIRDRYLIRRGLGGRTSRFHELKKVWGFGQFLSLAKFRDLSKGYLVDDTCIFGAEVFVYKSTGCGECLKMLKDKTTVNFTWRIENFSKIKEERHSSEVFEAGDEEWRIILHPNGNGMGKNNSISFFLHWIDSGNSSSDSKLQKDIFEKKVCADFKIRVRDQHHGKHINKSGAKLWFSASLGNWGSPKFMDISVFKDQTKGFLVNDVCIVEAEVTILGVVNKLN